MKRRSNVLLVVLTALVLVGAGCLRDDGDGNGDGNTPPPLGTTEGFTFPPVEYIDHTANHEDTDRWGGYFEIIHVIDTSEEVFRPQFTQIEAAREHFDNISVKALTITTANDTLTDLPIIQLEFDVTWILGTPTGDIVDELSLKKPLTVFLLDPDRKILLRSDDPLGQARMVQAIEATWGVEPPEDIHPEVGSPVPDLVWQDIDGNEGRLADLEGSPVILNVWEMECPFCLELFTELEKVWANHSADGLQMVSVDLITWETEAQVRGVREQYNATWTFAIDGDNIQSRYDIWRLPLLVLLDGEGVVQWLWTGYVHSSVISGEVEKLI